MFSLCFSFKIATVDSINPQQRLIPFIYTRTFWSFSLFLQKIGNKSKKGPTKPKLILVWQSRPNSWLGSGALHTQMWGAGNTKQFTSPRKYISDISYPSLLLRGCFILHNFSMHHLQFKHTFNVCKCSKSNWYYKRLRILSQCERLA